MLMQKISFNVDHHRFGGDWNHHSDRCSLPHPGAIPTKGVLIIGDCVLEKLTKIRILRGQSCERSLYTTMLSFFFKKCVLFLAMAKSEGGLPCPERTLATNSF